jgi:homoserine kinase type II
MRAVFGGATGKMEKVNEQGIVRVLSHYDLGVLCSFRRIRQGHVNDNWWVETTSGQYFLKQRHRNLKRPYVIGAQHALIQHLRDEGFPAPILVPSQQGATFLTLQNEIYEMFHYIPGALCDATDLAHVRTAARTLAWYHSCVKEFDHPYLHWPRERYGPTALNEIIRQRMDAWRGQTDARLDKLIEELVGHARDLTARFNELGSLPELIIHGDYYAENLILQGDAVAGVVDYDLSHWCTRSMELAEALIYFTRERIVRLRQIVYSGFLDLDLVQQFLKAYNEITRPLESEIRALPNMIAMIWLCASLNPPLEQPLSLTAAPQALPEILTLANWVRSRAEDIIKIGLATRS